MTLVRTATFLVVLLGAAPAPRPAAPGPGAIADDPRVGQGFWRMFEKKPAP